MIDFRQNAAPALVAVEMLLAAVTADALVGEKLVALTAASALP